MERSRFRIPLNVCVSFGGLWAIGCPFFINLSFISVSAFFIYPSFLLSLCFLYLSRLVPTFFTPYLCCPLSRYLVISDALLGLYKLTQPASTMCELILPPSTLSVAIATTLLSEWPLLCVLVCLYRQIAINGVS